MKISKLMILGALFFAGYANADSLNHTAFSNVGDAQLRSGLAVSDALQGGAFVRRVTGQAVGSGIEVGDIVIAVEGIEVSSAADFYKEIAQYDSVVEILIRDKDDARLETYVYVDLLERGSLPKSDPTPKPAPKPSEVKFTKLKSRWDAGYGSFLELRMLSAACSESSMVESYEFFTVYAHEYESRGNFQLDCRNGKVQIETGFGGHFIGDLSDSMDRLIWYNIQFPMPVGSRTIVWK